MSDLSVLTQQYTASANLSKALNEAVLVLKTVCEGLPGAETIPRRRVQECQRQLADIIAEVAASLAEPPAPPRAAAPHMVPAALLARLQADHPTDLEYFREDLDRVASRLRDGICRVAPKDVAMLDGLAATADAETSRVFRRLTRT